MVAASVSEIDRDLRGYLERVEAGETVLVLLDGRPIAEIRPIAMNARQHRPYGLCAGDFIVPSGFDDPLPSDVLAAFEGR